MEEKSVQVALMRGIYRKVKGLLVWFNNDEKVLMDLPYSLCDFENPRFVFGPRFPPPVLADLVGLQARRNAVIARCIAEVDFLPIQPTASRADMTIRQRKKVALGHLPNLPWFQRAWVFQEFVIRTKASVSFQAGSHHIGCQEMFNIIFGAQEAERVALEGTGNFGVLGLMPLCSPFQQMVRKMDERQGLRTPSTLPRFLSEITSSAEATNPRDYVYAFLEFWGKDADLVIPDYDLATEKVFTLSARKLVQASNNLDILGFCSGTKGQEYLLPSWVPNWGTPNESFDLSGHYDTEAFKALSTYRHKEKPVSDPSRLVVCGKQVDCKDGMFYTFPEAGAFKKLPDSLHDFIRLDTLYLGRSAFADLDSTLDATEAGIREQVFKVILAGAERPITTRTEDGKDEIHPPSLSIRKLFAAHDAYEVHSALEKMNFHLKRLVPNSDQDGVPEEIDALLSPWRTLGDVKLKLILKQYNTFSHIYWQALMACGRSIAKGAGNILGLVSLETKPGDLVCVLHGSKTPVILRRKLDSTYQVVGQCYWEGVMYGEGVTWSEDMADEFVLV